jgi:serine/threonine protein kinase
VVVYDPASKQLVVRNASPENKLDLPDCPYCHRPLRGGNGDGEDPSGSRAANFASPEYFRMLHHSTPGSVDSSRPPSPRRRLPQPVRSGRGTPARGPSNAEFVGSTPVLSASSHGISATAFSPDYFRRFFVEERELGRGGKGVVLLVKHVLDGVSLGHFALKRIPVGDDHEWLEKVLIEVQLLQHLSHQNLVSYRHVWLEDVQISTFGPSVPCAFVLQQYCNKGDLHNYICGQALLPNTAERLKQRIRRHSKNEPEPPEEIRRPRKLQFDEIYSFFKDITSGLNHLHVNKYIHRDLKPSNCLLHDTGNELRVLVSDFGEVQAENMARRATGATGTVSYCAPEVLRIDPSTGTYGNFTAKSDIFSLGMILYFLCFAELPYRNADHLNEENEDIDLLRNEIATWAGLEEQRSLRPELPEKLYKFLRRLLSLDPQKRPTAEEILHGIKTGAGLDEFDSTSIRAAGHVIEEVRNSTRILSLDTPPSGSPIPRSSTPKASRSPTRLGAPPMFRLPSLPRNRKDSSAVIVEEEKMPDSPSGPLVLRSRRSPSLKITEPQVPSHGNRKLFPVHSDYFPALKVVFLLLKILSFSLPCIPLAATPKAALPLLGLAILDLLLRDHGPVTSVVLMALHSVTVYGTWRTGNLCYSKASIWEPI